MSTELIAAPIAKPTPRDQRALNAYRHGLTGQVLVLPPAEQAAYRKHCDRFHDSLAPRGALETDLVQSIADDRWRLKRAAAMDMNGHSSWLAAAMGHKHRLIVSERIAHP